MMKWLRAITPAQLGVVTVIVVSVVLWSTRGAVGLTWDEPAYMRAAASYHDWVWQLWRHGTDALAPAVINEYWQHNHEHPPLVKWWFALVGAPLRASMHVIDAYRFAAVVLSALLCGVVVASSAHVFGRRTALVALAFMLVLPRFFFHAHLAALDVPGALAYIGGILLFWHVREQKHWWATVVFGVVWGLGLATKINAAFVLPTVALWWLCYDRQRYLWWRILLAVPIGLTIFVAVWPWLWVDPVTRIWEYVRWVTVDHWQIPQWFFGAALLPPPWYFAPVMVVMTTPSLMLVAALAAPWLRGISQRGYVHLIAIAALMPLLALMVSSTVYDNDRLLMAFYPLMALLAAITVVQLAHVLASRLHYAVSVLTWLICVLVLAWPLADGIRLWPHTLSYYSETIGGLPGAQRLQMDHTYWNETYADAIDFINDDAPANATVWVEAWSLDVPQTYQLTGHARADLQFGSDAAGSAWGLPTPKFAQYEADYVIVTYRFAGWTGATWALVASNRQPVYAIQRDGVPLLEVYRLP
jgi:4-amino-4-deoxy-L-arabinose transferase-like glycosyltransferase